MKRKLLSLLLSAVMLFTLVTPAFADEEQLPDEVTMEEIVGGEVGEETVTEDEGGEVTLFDGEDGTMPPDAPSGGGAAVGGGGGSYYSIDDDGVATFTLYEGFCAAMNDDDVTEVLIEENHHVIFSSLDETINITKPLTIDGSLRIENAYVMATADVTVNGTLEIYGDYDGHYTEWHMDAPEDYWGDFTEAPDTLDGPKLINNGEIEMTGLSGIMLSWPCDYEKGNGAKLSGGEFKYADYLNYDGADESNPGLTACYTEEQTTVETQYYNDNDEPMGEPVVLRTAFVNTEMGLKTALNSNVYNSSIQVFGKDEDDDYEITLSKEEAESGVYDAPCTLMTNVPFTVGEGVTLNLAEGTFNQFNNGLTIAGTLNVNTNGNMCFVNGNTQIVPGGKLMNKNGSNLCFNGDVTVAGEEDNKHGELYNSFGFMQFFGENTNIDGFFLNQGKAENCGGMTVSGHLRIEDSNAPITYNPNARDDWGNELGWETAQDHVLFNRDFLTVAAGGTLTVGGALKNDGNLRVFGEMNVLASAAGDNALTGVINGSVKSFGSVLIDGGKLTVEGAYEADATKEIIAHPYAAAFVSIGYCRIGNGAKVYLDGMFYQYDSMVIVGSFYMDSGSALYNGGWLTVLGSGGLMQSGYVQNDGEINVSGLYMITPAKSDNTGENDTEDDRSNPDSVLWNNGELIINGGQVQIAGSGDEDSPYCAIVHNNNRIKNEYQGELTLGGLLCNSAFIENWSDFTVAESGCIENHGQLRVGDSKSYGWGYAPITWEAEGGKPTEDNLSDDFQLRLAQMRWDNGEEWLEPCVDIYSIKGDEWHDMVIVDGQDYFGGWEEAENASVEMENLCYNGNGDRDEQGEPDPVEHIIVSEPDENGRFTLRFEEWGETRVVLEQTVTPEVGDPFERVYRYDGGVSLNNTGFYYDNNIVGEWNELDEERAQDAAVLGNCYCYNVGDVLYIMRRDSSFSGGKQMLAENVEFYINDERAEIGERMDDDWFGIFCGEQCVLEMDFSHDIYRKGHNIAIKFPDTAMGSFDLRFRYEDAECYLRCIKPTVFVEDVAGVKDENVTVAVKAENIGGMQISGYQLKLRYDPAELTPADEAVNGAYGNIMYDVDRTNGIIVVSAVGNTDEQGIVYLEDGELFHMTFSVNDTVGDSDDLEISFAENTQDFEQEFTMVRGGDEPLLDVALIGGAVKTFVPGDVHRDGKIDIRDAVRLLRYCVKDVELDVAEYEAALVVEGQSEPNVAGVLPILKKIVKGESLIYHPAQD